MPLHIPQPNRVQGAGNRPIVIDEFVGRVRTGSSDVSLARIVCPPDWVEPPQCPAFDELTLVLQGTLLVRYGGQTFTVRAGEAIVTYRDETVQYATPEDKGADYVAVCLPAYSLSLARRVEGPSA